MIAQLFCECEEAYVKIINYLRLDLFNKNKHNY